MKDERVWHVVGGDERGSDNLVKRFSIVAGVAVVAGIALSVAYSKSGMPPLTSAFAREAPPNSTESDAAPADDRGGAAQAAPARAEPERTSDESEGNLNGDWHFTTHVRSATPQEFEGLALVYRLRLKQDGERVTGKGQKISENGKALSTRQRTPIAVEGEREGNRLMLKFTERGARRASGGTFFLRLDEEGLRGTFASDAAGSKGEVSAERVGTAALDQKRRAR